MLKNNDYSTYAFSIWASIALENDNLSRYMDAKSLHSLIKNRTKFQLLKVDLFVHLVAISKRLPYSYLFEKNKNKRGFLAW